LSLTFLSFSIIGRFTLKALKFDRVLISNTAINIPIYGATGFVVSLLFFNFIGVFTIGISSLVFFSILTAFAFFILVRSRDVISTFHRIKKINWLSFLKVLVPLFLIAFTFFHFSFVMSIAGWPACNDLHDFHGPVTSILLWNGKITTTLEPITSAQPWYPIGFHILAANIASYFHLFPGEAVWLLGGLVMIMIPILMYSLTYTLTKSIPLSLLVYFSTFIIHTSHQHFMKWIVGFLQLGLYPGLTGIMTVIFSIYVLSLTEYRQPEKLKKRFPIGSTAILFFSLLALLLTYPNFSIFVAMIIIFIILKHHNELVIYFTKKPVSTIIPLLLAGGLTLYLFPVNILYVSLPSITSPSTAYKLPQTFLFDHITGYVMWVAMFISLILIYKKRYTFINFIYLIIFCMVAFTLSAAAPTILYLILPYRAVMIPWITCWLILSLGITEIFRIRRLKRYFHPPINSIFVVILTAFLILTPQFTVSIVQQFSYAEAKYWGWYTHKNSLPNDYTALLWIHYNVPPDDLILNDLSIPSLWILSISVKNVTYSRILGSTERDRARELYNIWEKPYEEYTVYQLLKKYNVRYVFVTSEPGCYDAIEIRSKYIPKPFTPEEYVQIFDTYPFLKIVFRLGLTTVYKVDFNSSSHTELNFDGIDLCKCKQQLFFIHF